MKIHKNTQKQKKQKKGATPHVRMPEWSKGADLRSAGYAAWVRTPLQTFFFAFLILVCGMGGILGVLKMISLKIVKKKLKLAREDNNL